MSIYPRELKPFLSTLGDGDYMLGASRLAFGIGRRRDMQAVPRIGTFSDLPPIEPQEIIDVLELEDDPPIIGLFSAIHAFSDEGVWWAGQRGNYRRIALSGTIEGLMPIVESIGRNCREFSVTVGFEPKQGGGWVYQATTVHNMESKAGKKGFLDKDPYGNSQSTKINNIALQARNAISAIIDGDESPDIRPYPKFSSARMEIKFPTITLNMWDFGFFNDLHDQSIDQNQNVKGRPKNKRNPFR